jgi:dipeptidyl aminopeptidase/acylaminoacyl peptidase
MAGGEATIMEERDAAQRNASFSPDGRWIAYEESGADRIPEVYVRAADGRGGRRQVSAGGGSEPRWTKGGSEIVFRERDAVLAASFDRAAGEPGAPVLLFRKSDRGRLGSRRTMGYDVTPDGSQFLMVLENERRDALPVVVVLNWLDELKRRVPR